MSLQPPYKVEKLQGVLRAKAKEMERQFAQRMRAAFAAPSPEGAS